MACSCNSKTAPNGWNVRKPDGTTAHYTSEVEARAAAIRVNGTATRA